MRGAIPGTALVVEGPPGWAVTVSPERARVYFHEEGLEPAQMRTTELVGTAWGVFVVGVEPCAPATSLDALAEALWQQLTRSQGVETIEWTWGGERVVGLETTDGVRDVFTWLFRLPGGSRVIAVDYMHDIGQPVVIAEARRDALARGLIESIVGGAGQG